MWNRLKWVLALALIPAALGQAGCNLDKTNRPALAGPSELAASLGLSANPDQLTANGSSSSVIEATLRGPDGNPAANAPVVFDLLARGASNFSDIGVLSKLNESRPIPGGPNRPETVTGTTNGNGVARVRYWSPFRTDQENDIVVTVTGRPEGNDFRDAVFRQVDIFLRAANRPNFPGGVACSILVEPVQTFYDVGQLIFFTATQISGAGGFPIARYEWTFDSTDADGDANTETGPAERNVAYAFESGILAGRTRTYVVRLTTTESQTGTQATCTVSITVAGPDS